MGRTKGRSKAGDYGAPVRIHSDVKSRATYLAALQGRPLCDYLSDLLRPAVDREMKEAGRTFVDGQQPQS